MRAFVGWLRGEAEHCRMVALPSLGEEDARRVHRERAKLSGEQTRIVNRMRSHLVRLGIRGFNPTLRRAPARLADLRTAEGAAIPPNALAELRRDMARLRLVKDQIKQIEADREARLEAPADRHHATARLLAQIHGLGADTADMLAGEVFSRAIPDRRALARYAGLTGAPDESGKRRREKRLARAGNVRVRRSMILLAWRFLRFQPDSELARWYQARTAGGGADLRKKMIVALARRLLIALWRLVECGEIPNGVILKPAN